MYGGHARELPDAAEIEIGSIGRYLRPPPSEVGFLPLNHYLQNTGWREIATLNDPGRPGWNARLIPDKSIYVFEGKGWVPRPGPLYPIASPDYLGGTGMREICSQSEPGQNGWQARLVSDKHVYTFNGNRWSLNPVRDRPDAWIDRIVANRFAPWTKQGVIFGVPHDVHPVTITYRADLFLEAGIDLASARTWPEFQELCLRFQQFRQSHGHALCHAIELPEGSSDGLVTMLLQRHVNLVDSAGGIHIADPKVALTLAFYARLVEGKEKIGAEASGGTGLWSNDLIAGNLCALLTPDWRANDARQYAPSLSGKLRMMPLPKFDETDARTSTWGGTMIGILRACPNRDAAWKLIECLYMSEEGLAARRKETDILPPLMDEWDKPVYHEPDRCFGGQKVSELYVELAREIPQRQVTPVTTLAGATLSVILHRATARVRAGGSAGLELACQGWLNEADQDLRRRIEHMRLRLIREEAAMELDQLRSFCRPNADAPRRTFAQLLWLMQHRYAPYLFVLPFLVLFCVFFLYPLGRSVTLSFERSAGPKLWRFVGLSNYRFLLADRLFWLACLNTFLYAALFLSLQLPLSLGLALLLNSPRVRFRNFFRFAFFSPYLVGQVFLAVLTYLLLAPRQGLANRAIGAILPRVGTELNWRGNPALAMPAIVLASLWVSLGYAMIYWLAALQSVDRELYEAAEVDGAGHWSRFLHVTLPGVRPVAIFLMMVGTIGALSLFELPYVFFQGPGPAYAGMTIVMYLYQFGFETGDLGYAAAVGWAWCF